MIVPKLVEGWDAKYSKYTHIYHPLVYYTHISNQSSNYSLLYSHWIRSKRSNKKSG